jgi:alpha-L-fucosidase
VKVQLSGTNYLSLAEVQVFGVPSTTTPTPTPSVNLAPGKAATQSSDAYGGAASRAVDGNTSGNYFNNSVTHTAGAAAQDWWQVDLGKLYTLDTVNLWNRTDCCTDRLSNFVVLASPTDMTGKTLAQLQADATVKNVPVTSLGGSASLAVALGGFSGRYVRVQLTGTNNLSLAEVQVLGR